ncbi:MAG: DUF4123 domain-containing protein [Hydrogenophaga sp.]|uniref:DUF4123 domain-containing protein n=1 Tax=Hydrogenophaga sp. TaxID=1904254 RepID=UPI004036B209
MYFPNDPHHPELRQHIEHAMARCQALHPGAKAYALVDACLDTGWAQELWQRSQAQPQQVQSLYQDTPLAGFEETAPFLCTLAGAELGALLDRTRSWPRLSFIQAGQGLSGLRTHLSRFASAHTADGARFPVRWGFPLGVPHLIEALAPTARALLLSGFQAWHLINRTGTLETVKGQPMQPPSSEPVSGMREHGFELSERAFARVVDESEVDALLIAEVERTPSLAQGRASELHRMARSALKEMDRLGLEGAPLRRQLLGEALDCASEQHALALIAAHAAAR